MERTRNQTVDGLRAIAALSVLAYHVVLFTPVAKDVPGARLLFALNFGVPVFFVLSGFVVYRPFVAARAAGRPAPDLLAYAARRAARIVPAYWVALLVLGVSTIHVLDHDWWRYFFFLQLYGPHMLLGLPAAWSLCVEVTFYAAAPVFAALVGRLGRGRPTLGAELWPLAALAALGLICRVALGALLDGRATAESVLPSTALFFAAGMSLAVLDVARAGRPALARAIERWAAIGRCWPAAFALFALVVLTRSHIDAFATEQDLPGHVAVGLAAGLLVAPVLRDGGLRPLGSRPLAQLGLISYGIYLWHQPIIMRVQQAGVHGPWSVGAGTLALSIVLAAASWRYVEQPAIALARRVGRRQLRTTTNQSPSWSTSPPPSSPARAWPVNQRL